VYRVGALLVGNADASSFRNELREELRKGGYVEGQNLIFEIRSAEEKLDLPKLAAELVSLKVDVIVAIYTPCAIAAKQATHGVHWSFVLTCAQSWFQYAGREDGGWQRRVCGA
jgi:putative tryptophan/tyrosine transport system substrate-binding protein